MSDNYSSEFKAKVALEAVSEGRSVIKETAEKYDVSEDEVIAWAAQLHEEASKIFTAAAESAAGTTETESDTDGENVDLSTEDEDFASAVEHGVMGDTLNYNKLIFWSTLGTSLVIIFVIGLVYFSQYSLFEAQKEASSRVTYSEIGELMNEQEQELNTYGVVDLEEGIYRIPIDSAISKIAID